MSKNKKNIDILEEEDIRKDTEEKEELNSKEIEDLKNQVEDLNNKYLSVLAEMQNYKKRADSELSSYLKYASYNVCRELIKVLDDFDRAIEHASKDESQASMIDGLKMIRSKFYQELEKEGVSQFDSLGKEFDPNLMSSLAITSDNTKKDGEVVSEFLKGYMYKDRVLRPAGVIVNKLENEETESENN